VDKLSQVAIVFAAALISFQALAQEEHGELGAHGLPARLQCDERPDRNGNVDIVFSATRIPDPKSDNGSTTIIAGVLHADDTAEGTSTTSDASGYLSASKASPAVLRSIGTACRNALFAVPGVAG
jgi:hypothetical protein